MSPTTPTHTILYDRDVGIVLTKDVSASVYGQATRQSSMAPVTVSLFESNRVECQPTNAGTAPSCVAKRRPAAW